MDLKNRYNYSEEYERKSLEALETALGSAPLYKSWRAMDPGPGAPVDERYGALPELNKAAMRKHFVQGLVPKNLNIEEALARDEIEYTFTSGTTGDKVVNLWNQKWWYGAEAASWKLNAHTAVLSHPQREAKLASALNIGIHCEEDLPMSHRIMGDKLYLNEKINILSWQPRHYERMARELKEFAPVILEANPSLLVRLAWWAFYNGRELYSPKVIIFTYELPSAIHLRDISKVFSSPMASSYGTTETGFVMMQCEEGLFHQNSEFCRIDYYPLIAKHGGPDIGRILVTTFGNPWASILRFDVGDLIRLHPSGKCACGRSEGLIAESIEGRTDNATFTTEGILVTPNALDMRLAQVPEVRDYNFVQSAPKKYEVQLLLIDSSQRVLDNVRHVLETLYGQDGEYVLKPVQSILPGPSGKYRRVHDIFGFDKEGLFNE